MREQTMELVIIEVVPHNGVSVNLVLWCWEGSGMSSTQPGVRRMIHRSHPWWCKNEIHKEKELATLLHRTAAVLASRPSLCYYSDKMLSIAGVHTP